MYLKKWKADTNWSDYEMHFAEIAHSNNIPAIQTSTDGSKF
jgi:hypothetical protein